jgi:L-alanine-DL-glutamate epimerase-like enolase superfamily enzyme
VVKHQLAPIVVGRCAMDVPGSNEAMHRAVRNIGAPGLVAGAVSAVDIGESWGSREARDLVRISQARTVVGADCELYVDANGGCTRKQAIRVAAAFADQDVRWFEEPVSSDDLPGLRQIRDAVLPDVTAGEYGYDLPYLTRMAASGAVDCLQADATRCGGITVWLRAAAVAEGLGLHLSGAPHVHAHAAAAVPNLRHLEWFHDHVRIEELLFDGTLDPTGGSIAPGHDGAPGHGLTFVEERAEPYRTGRPTHGAAAGSHLTVADPPDVLLSR